MKIFQKLFLFFAFGMSLVMTVPASSQDIKFQTLSIEDGLSQSTVYVIAQDSLGFMWFGTKDGLNQYDGYNFRSYKNDPFEPNTLSDNLIQALYADQAGMLWLGTSQGLNKLDLKTGRIKRYWHDPNNPNSLSDNFVHEIIADRAGALWIGTDGGLNHFDPQTERFTHYKNDPVDANSLSNNQIFTLCQDHTGVIWVGSAQGLNAFDPRTKKFTRHQHDATDPRSLSHNDIFEIFEDRTQNLWIGTRGGLNRLDRQSGAFTHFKNDPANSQSLSHNVVWSVYEDRAGTLWIGTRKGLNRFNRETLTFTGFQHDPANPQSLSDNDVATIFEDKMGTLWIGTYSGGLNQFDRRSLTCKRYLPDPANPQSLSHHAALCLFEDRSGTLWIGTDGGGLNQFQSYEVNDGLQSNEFNTGAYFQNSAPRNEMFFGGVNGFTVFHPAQIQNNPYRPPVVLTAFRKFDKAAELDTAITAIKRLKLSHKENFFAFEFAALDYTAPEKNRYAYRLEGFDRNWIDAGTRRYASYTNLDPGAYVFRVKGSNNDGVWNEAGAAVQIIITPSIWKTWWFRILAASAITGFLVWLYRHRVNRLLEMERLRVRIASDLHDDIGATLTKISLHSELIEASNEPDEIRDSLRKIGAMSRELVATMSDIVWSIDARNDTLGNLIDRMRDFATGVLSVNATQIDFNCAGLDLQKKLPVDFRQNIYLIFKEAINNIAKHADATRVDVQIKNANGHFNMSIRDDGKGWREHEYARLSGHGLRNMKMRAARIGGGLNISRNGGCTVSLTAPALR